MRQDGKGSHLITTPVEHSAVVRTVNQLADIMGFERTLLPVDKTGMVDTEDFASVCKPGTTLASVIYANNEVGTIAPIPKLAEQAHERGLLLHTDAVQAAGQLTLDVQTLGVDLMSISGHKFYGPKGVGALYVRDDIQLAPSQTGGSHEEGRRAGTHNTPLIVGMAKALQLAYEEIEEQSRMPSAQLTGHADQRLPSHASFVFEGVDSSVLLMHLDVNGIAASGGSACKTGNPEPSGVLLAMGYSHAEAIGSLRLTVGRHTTPRDVEYAVNTVVETVTKLTKLNREMSL
jgi:cysteine desulfurase